MSLQYRLRRILLAVLLGGGLASPATAEPAADTIVMIRHAEKPPQGLGQLDCRGLNRALALPAFIKAHFGRPDLIVAPSPARVKNDGGMPYSYVRPLITVEPTAIAFGLPVDATIGFDDVAALRRRLDPPGGDGSRAGRLVLVAWEHNILPGLAQALLAAHGAHIAVPEWASDDFDTVFVLSIPHGSDGGIARFTRTRQGLNDQPAACPRPAAS